MRSLRVLCLCALTLVYGAWSATPNWKPFFTLDSAEGTRFVVDTTTIILDGGVPRLHVLQGNRVVLGFSSPLNYSALELLDNGNRTSPLMQVSLRGDGGYVYLPNGDIRYITEIPLPTSTQAHHKSQIVSWISADGLNWTREAGVRFQPGDVDDSISSVPSVLQIRDSLWRMYYVGDFNRTNGARTALSSDWGMTWQKESAGNVLRVDDVDPQPVYLSNGNIRLYFRASMRSTKAGGVAYCDSPDGLHFDTTQIHVIIPDTAAPNYLKLDPSVIKFADGSVVCYFGAILNNNNSQQGRLLRAVAPRVVNEVAPERRAQPLLHPSPVRDHLHIVLPGNAGAAQQSTLCLRDALGRTLIVMNVHDAECDLDCSTIPNGLYSLEVQAAQDLTQSIVIIHHE